MSKQLKKKVAKVDAADKQAAKAAAAMRRIGKKMGLTSAPKGAKAVAKKFGLQKRKAADAVKALATTSKEYKAALKKLTVKAGSPARVAARAAARKRKAGSSGKKKPAKKKTKKTKKAGSSGKKKKSGSSSKKKKKAASSNKKKLTKEMVDKMNGVKWGKGGRIYINTQEIPARVAAAGFCFGKRRAAVKTGPHKGYHLLRQRASKKYCASPKERAAAAKKWGKYKGSN